MQPRLVLYDHNGNRDWPFWPTRLPLTTLSETLLKDSCSYTKWKVWNKALLQKKYMYEKCLYGL